MTELKQVSQAHDFPPARTGWRCVAVLTVLYWFGMLDRQIVALLLPQIKGDLHLTDTQASMILGPAFGLAFLAMCLPVGWLVDRISRRLVLFCGVITWSLGAIGSGLSRNFPQILSGRSVVGGGEASINMTAYTLLSDFFPPDRKSVV